MEHMQKMVKSCMAEKNKQWMLARGMVRLVFSNLFVKNGVDAYYVSGAVLNRQRVTG